jgi:N-acyl-D-aspartate/D-glutamate deacylase
MGKLYKAITAVLDRSWFIDSVTLNQSTAINNMRGLNAQIVGLQTKGLSAQRKQANLILFDLNTLKAIARYEQKNKLGVSFDKVWVNG